MNQQRDGAAPSISDFRHSRYHGAGLLRRPRVSGLPVSSAARRCCTRGRLVQPPRRFAGSTPLLLTPMLTQCELLGHSSPTYYSKK
jgi:hypothetical protein